MRAIIGLAAGLSLLGNACNLIVPEEEEDPPYTDPPSNGDQGKPLDVYFNGVTFGNNVQSPEVWKGKPPVSTGEADAPVITKVPPALRLGPKRDRATFPLMFSDITMLDPKQAPNRLIVKLRGVDWRWLEWPVGAQRVIDEMPAGYEFAFWLRTSDLDPLLELGTQTWELAFGEESGKVGEFVPIEVTVTENAAESYQGLECDALAARFNAEAQAEGFEGSYFCQNEWELCRTTAALSAKCGAAGNPDLVLKPGAGAESLTLEGTSKGVMCRNYKNLIPYKYDDMTGMPFDPRPWDETLGSDDTVDGCLTMLAEPGVLDDVRLRGFQCCP